MKKVAFCGHGVLAYLTRVYVQNYTHHESVVSVGFSGWAWACFHPTRVGVIIDLSQNFTRSSTYLNAGEVRDTALQKNRKVRAVGVVLEEDTFLGDGMRIR